MRRWIWAAVLCSFGLGACATLDPNAHARGLAQAGRLQGAVVQTDSFVLMSFFRVTRLDQPVHVYIEGDGRAWDSTTEPSRNPTPRRAMALQLAAQDAAANVVYLARPCQFTDHDPHCDVAYWTSKRYSAEVITAMDQAVSHYASLAPGQPVHLIGYSGGGALCVLVAARRTDVASIRTVAGNLDLDEVMRLHDVTPMPESINAMSEAHRVAGIPQLHFSGARDTVVPPSIAARFAEAAGGSCVRLRIVPGLGHEGDWPRLWPQLLAESVHC